MKLILLLAFVGLSYAQNPNVLLNQDDCACRLRTDARIVGGQEVKPNSIPWQVSLADESNEHFCGATLVNNLMVLTAAHCVKGKNANQIKVRVGLHELNDPEIESKTFDVEEIHQHAYTSLIEAGRSNAHPICKKKKKKKWYGKRSVSESEYYDAESDLNDDESEFYDAETDQEFESGDIAVLKLKYPVRFVKGKIEPACLNTAIFKEYNNNLMASGWGTTSVTLKDSKGELQTGELSSVLKEAYFQEDSEGCERFLICIDSNKKNSACDGDSGGPLHTTENGRTTVEGLASFVSGTSAQFGGPQELCTGKAAYTRLSSYKKWLENIIGTSYCAV